MAKLELKIPPVAVALVVALSMWIASVIFSESTFRLSWRNEIAIGLAIVGVLLGVVGVLAFRKVHTTVDPAKPETASVFVSTGVYNFSRNPMYLGILFVLASWGIYLSHPISLGFLVIFVMYMTRFQIIPEERALLHQFGQEYTGYTSRVRRWL